MRDGFGALRVPVEFGGSGATVTQLFSMLVERGAYPVPAGATVTGMTDAGATEPKPYSTGERVFGPPNGTFDPDWAATALRSNRPELDHSTSVRLVERAWELLRANGLRGQELADALDLEPGLASAVSDVATETARFYLDR